MQPMPGPQACPQVPQLASSTETEVHPSLQQVSPTGHAGVQKYVTVTNTPGPKSEKWLTWAVTWVASAIFVDRAV
jgi:hypothetical protein